MNLAYTGINIIPEILKLFPYNEETVLTADLMGSFNLILVAGGIEPSDSEEISKVLHILEDMNVIDIYVKDKKFIAKGLIDYGI